MNFKIKSYNNFDEKLFTIWSVLERECNVSIFQNLNWQNYWYKKIGIKEKIKPLIYVIYFDSQPIALFPFCLKTKYHLKTIEFLGASQNDYNLPLVLSHFSNNKYFKEIWSLVIKNLPKNDLIFLEKIPEYFNNELNPMMYLEDLNYNNDAYFINLPINWKEYSQSLSKKMISDNQRSLRRLSEKEIKMNLEVHESEFNHTLKVLMDLKERKLISSGAINILKNKLIKSFYENINEISCDLLNVHLSSISIGKKILAANLGIIYRSRFYYLFPSYDSSWSKYSPGRILLEKLIQYSINKKLKIFDLTIGNELYKKSWGTTNLKIFNYIKSKSFFGFIYLIKLKIIIFIKSNKFFRKFIMFLKKNIIHFKFNILRNDQ